MGEQFVVMLKKVTQNSPSLFWRNLFICTYHIVAHSASDHMLAARPALM
jgi:hypothetical protein